MSSNITPTGKRSPEEPFQMEASVSDGLNGFKANTPKVKDSILDAVFSDQPGRPSLDSMDDFYSSSRRLSLDDQFAPSMEDIADEPPSQQTPRQQGTPSMWNLTPIDSMENRPNSMRRTQSSRSSASAGGRPRTPPLEPGARHLSDNTPTSIRRDISTPTSTMGGGGGGAFFSDSLTAYGSQQTIPDVKDLLKTATPSKVNGTGLTPQSNHRQSMTPKSQQQPFSATRSVVSNGNSSGTAGAARSLSMDFTGSSTRGTPARPLKKEKDELDMLLMTPKERDRHENKQKRTVQVVVRVRPFLKGENKARADDDDRKIYREDCVLSKRGDTIFLVRPDVVPGASVDLITDLAIAGISANLDMNDWARPFCHFDNILWSLPDQSTKSPDGRIPPKQRLYNQTDVYAEVGAPLVEHVFNGVDVCCFAYGQTGSGKTYSMIGEDPLGLICDRPETFGVIPNALIDLTDRVVEYLDDRMTQTDYQVLPGDDPASVYVSMLEIYNDRLRDLLNAERATQNLSLREDPKQGLFVEGLIQTRVDVVDGSTDRQDRIDSLLELVGTASTLRVTNDNEFNVQSSRGHLIVFVDVTVNGRTSRAQFVDLAGSEKKDSTSLMTILNKQLGKRSRTSQARAAPAVSQTQRERNEILKSLSTLNACISGLSRGEKPAMLPFRDSKLTRLLKRGLVKNSHVIMLATVSPSPVQYEETQLTLQYAERLKKLNQRATSVAKAVSPQLVESVLEDSYRVLEELVQVEQEQAEKQAADPNGRVYGIEYGDPQQRFKKLRAFLEKRVAPQREEERQERELLALISPTASKRGGSSITAGTPGRSASSGRLKGAMVATSTALTLGNQQGSHHNTDPITDDERMELNTLRQTVANLEMQLAELQVDRDHSMLNQKNAQTSLKETEEEFESLQKRFEYESVRLNDLVNSLKRDLSLKSNECDVMERKLADLRKRNEQTSHFSQYQEEELAKVLDRNDQLLQGVGEHDRLSALAFAWEQWTSEVTEDHIRRLEQRHLA